MLALAVAATAGAASAQSHRLARVGVYDTPQGVVVSDPSTTLVVDLTVEKEVVSVGPYARYAQKYLGVRGALSDKTLCTLLGARVAVSGDEGVQTAGALPAVERHDLSYANATGRFARVLQDRTSAADLSLEEAAQRAANTIYQIRRMRMELITSAAGENVFGAGLQAALDELDRQEQAYTELFLGKRTVEVSTERLVVRPAAGKLKYIVCRFSTDRGVLPDSDLTGEVVLLQLEKLNDGVLGFAVPETRDKTATFRVAADVNCILYYGTTELTRAMLPVFELGSDVKLPLPVRK